MAWRFAFRFTVVFLGVLTGITLCDGDGINNSLTNYIRTNWDPTAIPRIPGNPPVLVDMFVELMSIREMDKAKNEIEIVAYHTYEWNSTITWSDDVSHLNQISVPTDLVWLPDITLYNVIEPLSDNVPRLLILHRDGTAFWVRVSKIRVGCDVAGQDKNNVTCVFTFGSWSHGAEVVSVQVQSHTILETYYIPNPNYSVLNATLDRSVVQYPCCPGWYETAKFKLQLDVDPAKRFFGWI